ncbi:NUDIX hydrolase [Streptomyces sp. TS71-3]|uniref:NUDIX hydrolase n=1 Tax=Streptomyces sp. TS71-3 TaxID=2733862 RepID=UPI001B09BAE0|nr:NUDIX domain-containing protein [Streptomyces sp. TS71-3]GHJ39026.1 hypothetical protein Sm713_46350 [Streptomyces sp. TS71-3]
MATGSLADVLRGHRPRSDVEAADLARARELLSAADPWDRGSYPHFTASALIVHPATRRALLRWHERQGAWLQVGGHADPGESRPLDIALREGAEEAGLADLVPWPDPSLVHLVIVAVPASAREPAHEHVDLRFLFATGTPEAVRPEKPTAPLRWLSLPQARDLTTEANFRETLDRAERLLDEAAGPEPAPPGPSADLAPPDQAPGIA